MRPRISSIYSGYGYVCTAQQPPAPRRQTAAGLLVPASNTAAGQSTKGVSGVWKLGDIVTSTPKLQSPVPLNNYFTVYKDATYSDFAGSSNYKNYGTGYAGANDGMLHAFNFGIFQESWTGQDRRFEPARLYAADPTQLGTERWAFIPKNVLPYLKYLTENDYCHVFSVDASPVIFDAAINAPTGCTAADYWNCPKQTVYQANSTALDRPRRAGGQCLSAASGSAAPAGGQQRLRDVNGTGRNGVCQHAGGRY